MCMSSYAGDESITLEVSSATVVPAKTIVSVPLPAALAEHKFFQLTESSSGDQIPVQVDHSGPSPQVVWIERYALKAGEKRRYHLSPASEMTTTNGVTVTDDGKGLLVQVHGKPVLVYNHAVVPAPKADEEYYSRSGYIHPLYNPSGKIVTDDFNPDHAHQHGIMLAWRKMTFEGREFNGWDQKSQLGRVEHAKLENFGSGPVFGFFKSTLNHTDLTATDGPKTALHETWDVRIYAIDESFVFDITSTQSCASTHPVSIDKIHYGGMTIRGHADWHKHRNYDFLTDAGNTKADGNQTRPRWVDLFGPLAGETTGVTIMDHPGNIHFPQPVRLHPTMPYFCFTPASLNAFTIEPETQLVSRYRFIVHDGPIDVNTTNQRWHEFADPPQVRIVKNP